MTSWRDEYSQALRDRDARERASYQRVDDDLISAYTDLLNRTAALEASKALISPRPASTDPNSKPKDSKARNPSSESSTPSESDAQLRADLAEALRSNSHLQSRIKAAESELSILKAKSKSDTKTIEELTREKMILSRKLRDRDEEIRGKAKLLDDVHDEVISLNLQLNMSEKKEKDLRAENKELIDRWMARKGKEAEEMNRRLGDTGGR